MMKNIQAIL